MKRFIRFIIVIIILCAVCSCDNYMAKHMGGTLKIKVEPGYKVTEATWKDGELWYFTEPMNDDYIPVTKKFVEHSEYGILEGTVEFIESK